MLFLVQCVDKANAGTLRQETRPAHLRYLEGFTDEIVIAGPTLAPDHQTPTGSVFIVNMHDEAAVERFCRNDPYAKAGLFERTKIQPFRQVIPA
jgi:uncharacterized protein YciI